MPRGRDRQSARRKPAYTINVPHLTDLSPSLRRRGPRRDYQQGAFLDGGGRPGLARPLTWFVRFGLKPKL